MYVRITRGRFQPEPFDHISALPPDIATLAQLELGEELPPPT